jgi:hypothetical protein
MKNIHLNIHSISTDKPSKLLYNSTLKSFCFQKEKDGIFINDGKVSGADFWGLEKAFNNGFHPQNKYITSDEFIEEDDFGLNILTKEIVKHNGVKGLNSYFKKIILTTDQKLIDDGIQSIDDDFLEWFVKNPSCEEVEVEKVKLIFNEDRSFYGYEYKIIIPKEESKQIIESVSIGEETVHIITYEPVYDETKQECCREIISGSYLGITCPKCKKPSRSVIEEAKQETLEEAVNKFKKTDVYINEIKQETLEEVLSKNGYHDKFSDDLWKEGVEFGVKWQQKRRYSEEEVKQMLIDCCGEVSCEDGLLAGKTPVELYKWIDEKFKKK